MSQHLATIAWTRGDATFTDNRYSRTHTWRFDGGAEVRASASPDIVPLPWSDPAAVDPEEAFVAAVASCHMLWFLSLAAKAGWQVDRYDDAAIGTMGEIERGRLAVVDVELRPRVDFAGSRQPAPSDVEALHAAAHARCFIANSIRSTVRITA
jgi:organic hydroperoxide reductase OsmC/OhrA